MMREGTMKLSPHGGVGSSAVGLAQKEGMMVPRMFPRDVCAFQIPIISPRLQEMDGVHSQAGKTNWRHAMDWCNQTSILHTAIHTCTLYTVWPCAGQTTDSCVVYLCIFHGDSHKFHFQPLPQLHHCMSILYCVHVLYIHSVYARTVVFQTSDSWRTPHQASLWTNVYTEGNTWNAPLYGISMYVYTYLCPKTKHWYKSDSKQVKEIMHTTSWALASLLTLNTIYNMGHSLELLHTHCSHSLPMATHNTLHSTWLILTKWSSLHRENVMRINYNDIHVPA